MNARDGEDLGEEAIPLLFEQIITGGKDIGIFIRDALNEASDFNDVVEKLSNAKTIVSAYFIVSGSVENEGAIISKD
eukprot:CAMPEP_0202960906 /NCGR_PEP_ID=MMETSP1396-20130829/5045_1 /ASSEMBLY_ACC=CAM_ASM_000872 /TAXON_ID= /ORGANISM="Pseudokeronopsis sp., Strain Brazil" /LENGTH=76 /DNA_ID=CAMNT_0049680433 /DNA_START=558 /DNA_END=788 /DNA_ORIENTATION=+